jgi:hypothetical protein
VLSDFIHSLNSQLELAINQVKDLKKELSTPGISYTKEDFIKKVQSVYNFTQSIKDSAGSQPDQVAKLCDRLLEELRLTFDSVVESMFCIFC